MEKGFSKSTSESGDFSFYRFGNLAAFPELKHFVTSGAENIGFSAWENPETIQANRKALAKTVGFEVRGLVTAGQIHSTHVYVVRKEDAGCGALDKISRIPSTDALVTGCEEICLMVLSADCVPVLLFDPVKKVIAAIHAGWRGTAAKIVPETIRTMSERFGCCPGNLWAGIGPSIGKCCFEVGEEVAEVFRKLFPEDPGIVGEGRVQGKFWVDLWEANRKELVECGVRKVNIEIAGMCSVCHPDHFFSYRRDGKMAGRFGAGIVREGKK